MKTTLTVVAQFHAQPGKEAEVKKALLSLVEPSRKDAGCVNYDLHQGTQDRSLFMFHENWTSQAHLDRHLAKPDLQAVLGKVEQRLAEPPQVTLWEKIG